MRVSVDAGATCREFPTAKSVALKSVGVDIKLVIALVAAASACAGGFITAVLGPVIKHHLEQSAAESGRRREQVEKWRNMLLEVDRAAKGHGRDAAKELQAHPDFLSLEPHLTSAARESVHKRYFYVRMGDALPFHLRIIADEISRIEREWKL